MFISYVRKIVEATLVAVGLLAVVSCERDINSEHRAEVSFKTDYVSTKATVTAHEDEITSLDLLVFRRNGGAIDAYNRVVGGNTITGNIIVGVPMNYYIVANAPEGLLSSINTESEFVSTKARLDQSTSTSLMMFGFGTITADHGTPTENVTVSRYVSKVTVKDIAIKWYDDFMSAPTMRLGRIALINACGDIPYSGTPTAGNVWYNQMNVVPVGGNAALDNVQDMLCHAHNIDIASSTAITLVGGEMYAMPNPTDNAVNSITNPIWSVRDTRVGIELIVNGETNWYCINLPGMLPNRHYVISEVTILGPGASNPDSPVERVEVNANISIKAWEEDNVDIEF